MAHRSDTTTQSLYLSHQPSLLLFPQNGLKQQQKHAHEQCGQDKSTKERNSRCKILTDYGTARFGTVYNVFTVQQQQQQVQETRRLQFMKYTAIKDIMKSVAAKRNKVKIARAGEKVYMLGDPVAGSEAEVFVFKEGMDVYKRVWDTIKENLAQGEPVEMTVTVDAYGIFDKRKSKCFLVHLGRGNESDVWISEVWWKGKCEEQQAGFLKSDNNNNSGSTGGAETAKSSDDKCECIYVDDDDHNMDISWLF